MIMRTIILFALLVALSVQPTTAQTADPITCAVTQTVTHSDGTKISSVRMSSNCVLLPVVLGG